MRTVYTGRWGGLPRARARHYWSPAYIASLAITFPCISLYFYCEVMHPKTEEFSFAQPSGKSTILLRDSVEARVKTLIFVKRLKPDASVPSDVLPVGHIRNANEDKIF